MNRDNKKTYKKLNISDISDNKFSLEEVGMVLDWLREFVRDGGKIDNEKIWEEWKEEAFIDLKNKKNDISYVNDNKDYVEDIYVVKDIDADDALQPIISGNLIIKTKSGKTYKIGVKDL